MKLVPKTVSRNVARAILKTKKNSPHIFFAGGLVAVVGGAVLACKATLKLEETLEEVNTDLDKVKAKHKELAKTDNTHTDQDYYRDLSFTYTKSAIKFGKLYGPAVLVGGAGIAALTGSHVQLTRRNSALTVTLAAVSKAYEAYRLRVAEEVGEERELEIYRAVTDQKKEIDGKNKTVKVTDPKGHSPYARLFDEASHNWRKDAEMNMIFLQCQQNYANQILKARGHLFLNEVYDSLGLDHTQPGAIVGWVIDGDGDNYVDFGLFEAYQDKCLYDAEPRMWLDFNVDGVIYDKI